MHSKKRSDAVASTVHVIHSSRPQVRAGQNVHVCRVHRVGKFKFREAQQPGQYSCVRFPLLGSWSAEMECS